MARGCSDITLDGTQLPPKRGHSSTHFSSHVCGQTAGWIKMPLGKEVQASAQATLRQMGTQLSSTERGTTAPAFRSMSIVVKRSPISATADLLYECHTRCNIQQLPTTVLYDADACLAEHDDGSTDYIAALQVWCQLLKLSITFNSGVTS